MATREGGGGGNYAATWVEFSNGRFGDVNSPAFGSQDLWGGFGHIVRALPSVLQSSSKSRSHRSHRWAHVIVRLRISRRRVCASSVAKSHRTHSPLRLFPASLSASFRTSSAWPRTDGGPWDSQPAPDGLQSDHGIIGWGPAGGYIIENRLWSSSLAKKSWKGWKRWSRRRMAS